MQQNSFFILHIHSKGVPHFEENIWGVFGMKEIIFREEETVSLSNNL